MMLDLGCGEDMVTAWRPFVTPDEHFWGRTRDEML